MLKTIEEDTSWLEDASLWAFRSPHDERKRSRSGTRIIRSSRCRNNNSILKPRESDDPNVEGLEKAELHRYENRERILF